MPARGNAAPSRPHDLLATLRELLSYMSHARWLMLAVAVLVTLAGLANLLGTYMIKPVVNAVGEGDQAAFARGVALAAVIYVVGVASAAGYTQLMVRAAQRVVLDVRRDLFAHIERLPLSFFDRARHGDVMSYFTNDVDTVSEALNNSFANLVQAAVQIVGTLVLLLVLDWRLTLVTIACDAAIALYVRFSGGRSSRFFSHQQAELAGLDGYVEEMIAGQKVVKVFNHEDANLARFSELNERLRAAGTTAQSYAATMVPVTVCVGYVNYAIVCVLGALLAVRGLTDVGSLASYLVFVRQAAAPLNQFTQQGNFLLTALAGAERIFSVMRIEPEVDEGEGAPRARRRRGGRPCRRRCRGLGVGDLRRARAAPGRRAVLPRGLWLRGGADRACGPLALRQAGPEDRVRGLHGRGQDHDHQPYQPLLRGALRRDHLRRH